MFKLEVMKDEIRKEKDSLRVENNVLGYANADDILHQSIQDSFQQNIGAYDDSRIKTAKSSVFNIVPIEAVNLWGLDESVAPPPKKSPQNKFDSI